MASVERVATHRLIQASAALDPASRALLNLWLHRGLSDDVIAKMAGLDLKVVAARRLDIVIRLGTELRLPPYEVLAALAEIVRSTPGSESGDANPEFNGGSPSGVQANEMVAGELPAPGALSAAGGPLNGGGRPDGAVPADEGRPGNGGVPLDESVSLDDTPALDDGALSPDGSVQPVVGEGPAVPRDGRLRRGLIALAVLAVVVVVVVVVLLVTDHDSRQPSRRTPGTRTSPSSTLTSTTTSKPAPKPKPKPAPKPKPKPAPKPKPTPAVAKESLEPLSLSASHARGTITVSRAGRVRKLNLTVSGLPSVTKDHYEAWLYNSIIDSHALGRVNRRAGHLSFTLPADAAGYHSIDISLQPPGYPYNSGQSILRAKNPIR